MKQGGSRCSVHGLEQPEQSLFRQDISGDHTYHPVVFHNGHGRYFMVFQHSDTVQDRGVRACENHIRCHHPGQGRIHGQVGAMARVISQLVTIPMSLPFSDTTLTMDTGDWTSSSAASVICRSTAMAGASCMTSLAVLVFSTAAFSPDPENRCWLLPRSFASVPSGPHPGGRTPYTGMSPLLSDGYARWCQAVIFPAGLSFSMGSWRPPLNRMMRLPVLSIISGKMSK